MRGYCTTEFTYVIAIQSQQENTTSSRSQYAVVEHDISGQQKFNESQP